MKLLLLVDEELFGCTSDQLGSAMSVFHGSLGASVIPTYADAPDLLRNEDI